MLKSGKVGAPWPADLGPLIGMNLMLALSKSIKLIQGCAFREAAIIDSIRYSGIL
jgi:hypothetical protein